MNSKNEILTIAISTLGENYSDLIKKIISISNNINNKIIFFIIVQTNHIYKIKYPKNRISVLFSNSIGLSVSRNIALNNVNTKWIWFQDDDIMLNVPKLNQLITSLQKSSSDVFLTKVLSLESKNDYYKNYSFYNFSKKRIALHISSIEIIANINFIKKNKVWFCPHLGLGAKYPLGEENLFLLKIINNGGKIYLSNIPSCFHTTKNRNNIKNNNLNSYNIGRGILLKEFSFVGAFFVGLKWIFNENHFRKKINTLKFILKGYCMKNL